MRLGNTNVQELSHGPSGQDGQVATNQHTVRTGQYTLNTVLVLADELFQGRAFDGSEIVPKEPDTKRTRQGENQRKDFRSLKVGQKAHELAVELYSGNSSAGKSPAANPRGYGSTAEFLERRLVVIQFVVSVRIVFRPQAVVFHKTQDARAGQSPSSI